MKQSAGLLMYRKNKVVEVLLVHPGGPFWARKDKGAWSIPKGECEPDEDHIAAAKREYREETGFDVPDGELAALGEFQVSSNKKVYAWAIEGDVDAKHVKSNMFEMEWPPKSGQTQQFAEIDRAGWFPLAVAVEKATKGQVQIIQKLAQTLDVDITKQVKDAPVASTPDDAQVSMF